jgi:hypothetical protein
VVLTAVWTCSDGVVIVVIVIVVLWIQRAIVVASVVAARWGVAVLSAIRIVLCLLARLLALPSLHPSLLQQTSLLGQAFAFLPILDLVLPDESQRRVAEDVLIFAELADPRLTRWVVEIGVLLVPATLAGSMIVQLLCTASRLPRRRGLLWRWGSSRTACTPIWKGRRRVCTCPIHVGTRLGALGRHHRGVWANGRASAGSLRVGCWSGSAVRVSARRLRVLAVLLAGPDHLIGRVGAAGEGELCLVCAVLRGFLLQQADVLVAVGWRGCLGVGDGSRDDAALLRRS